MHKPISNCGHSVKLPMANFSETTSFILSHRDVVFGVGLPIESAAKGDSKFTLSVESNGQNTGGFTLEVSGKVKFESRVRPNDLADAVLAGRPLIPALLSKAKASADLIALATAAVYDPADQFEAFTLGGVTARIVHDTAPSNPQTPAGYRLTIRVKKGETHHFALPVAAVADAIRNSQPVLGYALDLNPGAAKILVDAVGLSVVGIASAHQKDVDKDAVAITTTIFSKVNLPSGRKPPL